LEYATLIRARVADREARLARFDLLHARMGSVRLALGASFLIAAWLCFGPYALPAAWLFVPVGGFIAAIAYHQRVKSLRSRVQRAVAFYRLGIDRMQDRWRGTGRSGGQFDEPHHIYAADLDLFGAGSLFELLCAARTQMGESTLARWLLKPADLDTIRERHAAIADLRERLDFREDLGICGDVPFIAVHSETLTVWSRSPNQLDRPWIRWTVPALGMLAVAAAAAWGIGGLRYPLLAVLLAEIAVMYGLKKPVAAAIAGVENAYEDLKGLSLLLKRIEAESFEAPRLRTLLAMLTSHARSASETLSRLATIVNFVESRRNPLLAPLMLLVMYPLQAALAAERWRTANGAAVGAWLDVLGEIEALVSLARYADEHPQDRFPEFIAGSEFAARAGFTAGAEFTAGAAAFRAAELGHPLIPAATRVCNDVDISYPTRLLLVSGSNMSGKSTLLRTVGVNTVLAMAGAPVRARRLQLTPLQVGASIRINDSLHEGSSRFYAEITRLRQLFEPSALPMLFLLDELLQGTNSADRRIGAQGVIRALIERGSIGLISTHDLSLVDVPGLADGVLVNVHFQDELHEGRLTFDFKLQDGIVTKSNGIELMRSIGLDV
jgi:hypothetical protein